jgi:small subunit ribosomal protein S5
VVLELAGVENALDKELGSKNPLNNARVVVEAVGKMKQFRDVELSSVTPEPVTADHEELSQSCW